MDLFLPQLSTAIAGVFSLLVLFYFLSSRLRAIKSSSNLAPEAGGAWPIIGHLHLLGGSHLPHKTLGAMADKYGPVFTIRLGVHRALVVSNWEMAKDVFTTSDVAVSSRPKMIAGKHLGYNDAMFGFSPYGPYWRELRKIASLELLSSRRLQLLQHVRVSETGTSIKELYEAWAKNKNESGSGRVLVEMKQWFGDLTFNVVVRMVAGKRYFGVVAAGEEEEARRCQKAMRKFFHLVGAFVVGDSLPFVRWLDLDGNEKAMRESGKEMDCILEGWLEEHRRKGKLRDDGEAQDFMDVLLSIIQASDLAGFDADTITKATCMLLISGGTDTTKVMLTWTLSLLLNNRHALKKVQEELDVHVGKDRQVNESDINNLVYLRAVVKETLRLYPAGPLGGIREFSQDCTIGDYNIPKGTRLLLNVWKLQRDPRVWPDPSEFRPERFLTTHKDVDVKGQHFELTPFGAGRRLCPGITFGLQMLHLVLATLVHGFDVSTPSDALVDMTESAGLTNLKVTPLEVLLAPRLSPNLY